MSTPNPSIAGVGSSAPGYSRDTIFTEVLYTLRKYNDAHQTAKSDMGFHVELPRMVVVGERNAGKSSLLENITKRSVFPRDNSLCTKVPIRLKLKQVRTADERSRSVTYMGERHEVPESAGDRGILDIVLATMDNIGRLQSDEIEVAISEVSSQQTKPFDLLPCFHQIQSSNRAPILSR